MNRKQKALSALLTAVLVLGAAVAAQAQSTTLAWDLNTDPDVKGYIVSYGTASGSYVKSVDAGNVNQFTVTGLDISLDYYFAVQAYNSAGLKSDYSNEVRLPAPVPPGTTVISSLTANKAYPLLMGVPVTWTAAATSTRGAVQYKFLLYSASTGWTVVQDYSSWPSFSWTPGLDDMGTHYVQVWARSVGSTATYEAWVATNAFDVTATQVQLTSDTDFPSPTNNPVKWTATVAGTSTATLEYKFVLLNQGTGVWSILRDYAQSNTATWTPTTQGNYILQAWARRVGSTAQYEVWGGTSALSVSNSTALQVTNFSSNVQFPAATGTPITWTVRAKGGTTGARQYQFVRYSAASGWSIVKPWSSSMTYTLTPAWGSEGNYGIQAWVRSAGSTAVYDTWAGMPLFDVVRAPLQVTVGSLSPLPPGTAVTIKGLVGDTTATFEYQFWLYNRGTGTWSLARTYSTNGTFVWTPTSAGSYLFQVWARKVGSTADYDLWKGTDYIDVASGPAQVVSLTADQALPARAGTAIKWTAIASGGTASPLQYKFVLYTEGVGWSVLSDWSTSNTVTWTPTSGDIGNHVVQVWVRSAGSTQTYEGWMGSGMFGIQP
jgi:hypothetical protein